MSGEVTEDDYPILKDESELLLRQVHPDQLQLNGSPDSSAFRGKPDHRLLLSTRREAIGAKRAYEEWTVTHDSAGTWGIPVHIINEEKLVAFDDSSHPDNPDGHASVDFNGLSDGIARKKAKRLRDASEHTTLSV